MDLENLIKNIKEKAPKAKIIVIGDWWSIEKNSMRIEAANNTGCTFADLLEVIGNSECQSVTGKQRYLEEYSLIEVSEAASTHPGDLGMKYIADRVIQAMK